MKNLINILTAALLLITAQISIAADELGEYCFAGSFHNTGECIISVEVTQHNKYFSLNGLSHCEAIEGKEKLSDPYIGIAHGNGYIDNQAIFNGALDVFTSANSDLTPKSLFFWVDLNTQKVEFKATTDGKDICNPFNNCDSMISFDRVACP